MAERKSEINSNSKIINQVKIKKVLNSKFLENNKE